jgi:hypothetical protein
MTRLASGDQQTFYKKLPIWTLLRSFICEARVVFLNRNITFLLALENISVYDVLDICENLEDNYEKKSKKIDYYVLFNTGFIHGGNGDTRIVCG